MSLSVSTQASPIGTKLVQETAAGATPDNNVTGAAGSIYLLDIDNSNNSDNPAYLKVYDNAAPVVGTTAPDLIVRVPANQRRSMAIPEGWAFTALSFACVISGGTAGSTGPTNPVPVRIVAT